MQNIQKYKILQNILVNTYWLHKWNIEESNVCKICELTVDNIRHVFWDCRYTQVFWEQFKDWWNEKHTNDPIDVLDMNIVFLGTQNKVLCEVVILAKQYIHYKRIHNESPTLVTWLLYCSKVKAVELAIAKQNNTLTQWLEKWEPN